LTRPFVVYGLARTYPELGEHEFKVVLDPGSFKNSQDVEMRLTDSDGNPIASELRRWGRKIVCKFTVDSGVSDGVASVMLSTRESSPVSLDERLTFWVIKSD
jgi:hypothetical protein